LIVNYYVSFSPRNFYEVVTKRWWYLEAQGTAFG
jgi:hypothetical protein